MSIQPVSSANVCFLGKEKTTEKGNTYKSSSVAKIIGFSSGVVLAGGLMYSQVKFLKTFTGKRNLIEGYHEAGKALNDVMKRVVKRDEHNVIVPATEPSERTKKIVSNFKTTVGLIGAGITAGTTLIGKFIDVDINSKRAKSADIANPIPSINPVRK